MKSLVTHLVAYEHKENSGIYIIGTQDKLIPLKVRNQSWLLGGRRAVDLEQLIYCSSDCSGAAISCKH